MTFGDLQITIGTILAGLAALIVIMNFIDKIKAWAKPGIEKDASVEDRISKHEIMLATDKKRLDANDLATKAMLASVAALLDHSIYGNNIEALKTRRAELNKYLIER